jgi:HK97 family phage prohead protease
MVMSSRAYSLLDIKEMDDKTRTFVGIATTPSTDLMEDIVEPKGGVFQLPIPFLWQHDSDRPVGHVISAKVLNTGIEVKVKLQQTDEPGPVKDRLDSAWQDIKLRLVRGLSIGFKGIETARIEGTFGTRFIKWLWLELSAVTIAANSEASILSIKQFDTNARAATGHIERSSSRLPGATGSSTLQINSQSGKGTTKMTTILELQEKRKNNFLRIEEIDASANGRTKTEDERKEFKTLRSEIEALDVEIDEKQFIETAKAGTAKVVKAGNSDEGTASRGWTAPATAKKKEEPGIRFTRYLKARAVSKLEMMTVDVVAKGMYGQDSETYHLVTKANEVLPGTTVSGNWGYNLISQEGGAMAEFLEFLREGTIVGKFGTNGIPALRTVPFYRPIVSQTEGGDGYWVGEAKPKTPVEFGFNRDVLTPLKMANICVLSDENIRYSTPESDVIIRDQLAKALIKVEDLTFVDPSNGGSSGVKPASITNGAPAIVATGTGDADDIILDIRSLLAKYTDANNDPTTAVFIMSPNNANALGTMLNALGQLQFPTMSMRGGMLMGYPVIVSKHVGTNVVLVNANDILINSGSIQVDVSNQASIEMKENGHFTQDGAAGTGASLVSLWQNNLVAFRAEKVSNWMVAPERIAVAYLTATAWGGAVVPS